MNAAVEHGDPDPAEWQDLKDSSPIQLEMTNTPAFGDADSNLAVVKQEEPMSDNIVAIKTEPVCKELDEKFSLNLEEVVIKEDHWVADVKFQLGSEHDTVLPIKEVDVKSGVVDEVADTENISNVINEKSKPHGAMIASNSKSVIYKCSLCRYSCSKRYHLQRHMERHSINNIYKCSQCSYKTTSKINITNHRIMHIQEKRFKCNQCDYRASTNYNLNRHQLNHMNDKPFKCNLCKYSGVIRSRLKEHMKCHTRQEKQFKCSACSFETFKKETLKVHVTKHMAIEPLKCDECDFETARKINLKKHKMKHVKDMPVSCEGCDFRAKNRRDLNRHLKNHSKDKPFKCSMCNYSTDLRRRFREHTHTSHRKPCTKTSRNPFEVPASSKQYRCDKCSFADKDINALVTHMQTHLK